jgi:hypothetical protein
MRIRRRDAGVARRIRDWNAPWRCRTKNRFRFPTNSRSRSGTRRASTGWSPSDAPSAAITTIRRARPATAAHRRGTIYTYTVMHQPNVAGFESEIPYVNIVVELDEQPMLFMVATLPHAELGKIRIGGRVEVCFEERGADLVIPQFRPV